MSDKKYEIVKFVDNGFELEVNVSPEEETVWLSQEYLSLLFDTTKQNISLHISNILKEGELDSRTVKDFFTVQDEGGRSVRRSVKVYNLDMIISVGYRLKSKRGIVFRRWANSVLKQYLLKGYAIDKSRVLVTQENYINLVNVVNRIDSKQEKLVERVEKLEEKLPDFTNKLFSDGRLWDAVSYIESIIGRAEHSIILIDNYVDKQVLDIMSKKHEGVTVLLVTSKNNNKLTSKEINAFNLQYKGLIIQYTDKFHDRFIIIDEKECFICGASIKDAGKKVFSIMQVKDVEIVNKLLGLLNTQT